MAGAVAAGGARQPADRPAAACLAGGEALGSGVVLVSRDADHAGIRVKREAPADRAGGRTDNKTVTVEYQYRYAV